MDPPRIPTHPLSNIARWVLWLYAVGCAARPLAAQTNWRDGFDGSEVSWRIVGADVAHRVEAHVRSGEGPHSGGGCELVELRAGNGTYIHLARDIGRARVIDELVPSLWVWSDRGGPQLLARVVLPRTQDPRTGKPLARLIAGDIYDRPGHWQPLRLNEVPRLVAELARGLRTEFRAPIDTREAYLDRLILNVYCGAGRNRIRIDNLEIAGLVDAEQVAARRGEAARPEAENRGAAARPRVERIGAILLVDGKPLFPRIAIYRGEALASLKQLGFNTVMFHKVPSGELLAEAAQNRLWVVCPPPRPAGLEQPGGAPAPLPAFDARFDSVLAWHLGDGLTRRELPIIQRWAELVRRANGPVWRPLLCRPETELNEYSRTVDILLIDRFPLGTSFELNDYTTWLRERSSALARPGTPLWTTIETQYSPAILEQIARFSPAPAAPPEPDIDQVRLLVHAAIAAGARGLIFASDSRLDAADSATRARTLGLQLLNLELELIQPWIAAGSIADRVDGTQPAGEARGLSAVVLVAESTRLLLPLWSEPGAQFVSGQAAGNDLSFVVPGVPEAIDAYQLTAGGLRALKHERKRGGVRVQLDEFGLTSMVLLTDDLALSDVRRRLAKAGPQYARWERELAVLKLQEVARIDGRLAALGQPVKEAPQRLALARESLSEADEALAAADYLRASLTAHRALRPLRLLERAHWERAVKSLGELGTKASAVASPPAVCFDTLPDHWQLLAALRTASPAQNRLPAGDMEDVQTMVSAGWRKFDGQEAGVETNGSLVNDPHSGRRSLWLSARPFDPESAPELVESRPVWVSTPAVPVRPGQWLRIHGWVNVPGAITGSLDGLLIADSLAGDALAERIGQTKGWQEFTMYRAAGSEGQVRVTFSLTGLGEACIDDVTIEPMERGRVWRPGGGPPMTGIAPRGRFQPLLERPGQPPRGAR